MHSHTALKKIPDKSSNGRINCQTKETSNLLKQENSSKLNIPMQLFNQDEKSCGSLTGRHSIRIPRFSMLQNIVFSDALVLQLMRQIAF